MTQQQGHLYHHLPYCRCSPSWVLLKADSLLYHPENGLKQYLQGQNRLSTKSTGSLSIVLLFNGGRYEMKSFLALEGLLRKHEVSGSPWLSLIWQVSESSWLISQPLISMCFTKPSLDLSLPVHLIQFTWALMSWINVIFWNVQIVQVASDY